jgi:flagellar biosynthesis GTPase FlhF
MQSLDGIKPSSHDVSHKELEDKLGYQSRPLTDAVQPNGYNPVQKHQNQLPSVKNYISPTSKTDEEHTSPLHSRSTEEKRPPHKTKEEQVNEAMKVESLLMELFPDKYGPPKKKTKAKKSTSRHHEVSDQSLSSFSYLIPLLSSVTKPGSGTPKSIYKRG